MNITPSDRVHPRVLIIGGGLSGLSAAVELAGRGYPVTLLEQRQHLGGRTYSFVDEVTGDVVDNGQHLLMGCYHQTRRYLKTIGSESRAFLQPNLRIEFLHPRRGPATLSCPASPAPLHLLGGLLGLNSLSWNDRLRLLRVGLELQKDPMRVEPQLSPLTVDEWLTSLGQSPDNKKYLWDVIAIGSLNDDPRTVSALLFYRVLRSAFLGARENSSLLIPRVGLSELLVDPALKFLESRGSSIRMGVGVDGMEVREGRVRSVRSGSETFEVDAVIAAVPYYALDVIAPGLSTPGEKQSPGEETAFESSPIITINLWFDKPVMEQEFVALLDSRVHWVFNKSRILASRKEEGRLQMAEGRLQKTDGRQYVSLVISGASGYVEMEKEEIVRIALEDLRYVFPEVGHAKLVHSLVVKEKRATFSPTPWVESLRPSSQTRLQNLFLAGDWTNTGYPATIEGAVMSGRKAAELIV
ncbi:MAG: FAD-dependent oxidoreductase [Ignavibacteriales bacterium]|nr:FAD-dependent oxidoreductase [Ignavibacteriales bacterium]